MPLDSGQAMLEQQLKLAETLTVKLSNSSTGQLCSAGNSQSINHIANSITEFLNDHQAHINFNFWYKQYEDVFFVDMTAQEDAWKVQLLLRKQGLAEHERYANLILLKDTLDISFADTLKTLSQIFAEQSSLFNT
ncbi:unnamed protein product [Dibothriocephalus latus]|uniref:DUF7083 domain-containing protein n=1 Tax=Dibothriocephalus latus TaxID=60516 RepID=A0A3P7P4S1_DIBLA|nr:unnamed protein product [Dibothriocephalus latus]